MAAARIGLHPACRVRKETFGLLFYDARGPRLLFAQTGNLLTPEFFNSILYDQLDSFVPSGQVPSVQRLINTLAERGFLREQPVC